MKKPVILSIILLGLVNSSCVNYIRLSDANISDLSDYEKPCNDLSSFYDPRDSTLYKTTQIGDQCWINGNLQWLPNISKPDESSHIEPHYYVYDNRSKDVEKVKSTDNYQKFGVLYNWPAATDACPPGWTLPSMDDWSKVNNYLDDNYRLIHTKSIGEHHLDFENFKWQKFVSANPFSEPPVWAKQNFGTPSYVGFLRMFYTDHYFLLPNEGLWWSSNEKSVLEASAYNIYFSPVVGVTGEWSGEKAHGLNIRCIRKDNALHSSKILSDYLYDVDGYNEWLKSLPPKRGFNPYRTQLVMQSATFFSMVLLGGLIFAGTGNDEIEPGLGVLWIGGSLAVGMMAGRIQMKNTEARMRRAYEEAKNPGWATIREENESVE